jgi:hypothetical protein
MKRMVIISAVMIMSCDLCSAGVSVVKNGSFEYDGYIGYITQDEKPKYWCSIFYDASKYDGYVNNNWATNESYSLTLESSDNALFQQGGAMEITQNIFVYGVLQISFDIQLTTDWPGIVHWDSHLFNAFLDIDGVVIWDSNQEGIYDNGQFHIEVNNISVTEGVHLLTVGIVSEVDTSEPYYYRNIARWDSIAFDASCDAVGYQPADFTHDCRVDINDLAVLAEGWLDPNGPDLTGDSDVNFADFAVLGNSWLDENSGGPFIPDANFVFLDGDLDDDGIVDYSDVLILCNNWLGEGGSCVREDLKDYGLIDFKDFAALAEQWREIGDLYGL